MAYSLFDVALVFLRIYFNCIAVHLSVLQAKKNMAQSIMMWHNSHQTNGATDISFQVFDQIYACGHDTRIWGRVFPIKYEHDFVPLCFA